MRKLTASLLVLVSGTFSGCVVNVLKPGYDAAVVKVRLHTDTPSEYSLQIDADGPLIRQGSDGRFLVTLPEIPRRCHRHLLFPEIPLDTYPIAELRVLRDGKLAARHRTEIVHQLSQENGGVVELSVR